MIPVIALPDRHLVLHVPRAVLRDRRLPGRPRRRSEACSTSGSTSRSSRSSSPGRSSATTTSPTSSSSARSTRAGFAYGVQRFVVGLGKKVLIANTLAVAADLIFAIPGDQLTTPVAWLGVLCYTLQIYFDFSGYSDMAIGLGHMFGFRFLENFNYPYISQSLTEFWRRWHISLSTGSATTSTSRWAATACAPWRVYVNLVTVFFLCGLWHGASWTFVVWGLFHGAFLVIERMGLARWMETWWRPFRHLYLLLVVIVSWVFFRAATLARRPGLPARHGRAVAGLGARASARPLPRRSDRAGAGGRRGRIDADPAAIKGWLDALSQAERRDRSECRQGGRAGVDPRRCRACCSQPAPTTRSSTSGSSRWTDLPACGG